MGDSKFLHKDVQIERWAHMRENMGLYYTFNARNVRLSLLFLVVVPFGLYKLAQAGQVRFWSVDRGVQERLISKRDSRTFTVDLEERIGMASVKAVVLYARESKSSLF